MNAPVPPPSAAVPSAETKTATDTQPKCLNASNETGDLFAALAKAQGKFVTVKKDAENPFFKSCYATLAAIVEMIRKPLSDNGLAFFQSITGDISGKAKMNTLITHSSGQFVISSIPFNFTGTKPQELGSAITYAKRYGLQSAFGVVVAEDTTDDDGNEANGNRPCPTPKFNR